MSAAEYEKSIVDEGAGYENPNYPCVVDAEGVPRINGIAVDPFQGFRATELALWPLVGNKFSLARPHMRAFHFQWMSFFIAFVVWFASAAASAGVGTNETSTDGPTRDARETYVFKGDRSPPLGTRRSSCRSAWTWGSRSRGSGCRTSATWPRASSRGS